MTSLKMSMHSLHIQIWRLGPHISLLTSFCDFSQKEQRSVLPLSSARIFCIAGEGVGGSGAVASILRRYFLFFGKVMMVIQLTAFITRFAKRLESFGGL